MRKPRTLKNIFLFYVVFLGLFSALRALDPQRTVTQYKLEIWQKERGYEQHQIYTILQSRDGYLWLGTHAGLQVSKAVIEEKNRNIMASITYARKIQQASLPTEERLKNVLKDYFIIFRPRDIVSGDFYWFGQNGHRYFIAAVDCTGHGVPGAFLSMMGNMELTEIVKEKPVHDPAALLMHLHNAIRRALQQETGDSKSGDGMEVAACMIDRETGNVTFAGAGRPLYYVCNSELFEIKGDRKSIGGRQREKKRTFKNHEIPIRSETVLYLTSDGFADQNNSENKKYGSLRLKQFLKAHAHLPMDRQQDAILLELRDHQGIEEQRDDITIIGIKLNGNG